jgi:signal transduction histidine kinase
MSGDTVQVVAIAAGWSLTVGLGGGVLALWLRHRSLRWSAALLVLVAVGGIVAGVVGTANAMFLSRHDLTVVFLVCLVSGLVSTGLAFWLAERVARSATTLRGAATRLGEGGGVDAATAGPLESDAVAAELARSAERLRRAAEHEARVEESRRELVAWVSHDLRTPLAGIRAMAEALEDGIGDDAPRYHTQIRAEVDRMVSMVDDLFELSRIHAGALDLSAETVPLGDLVSETIATTDPVARTKGVRVGGSVDPEVLVHADPAAMSRVVANLVMNAIRHTPADGTVEILGRADDGAVELSVSDGCGGIPAPDLPRVFDVAWRGAHARTPGADVGAGLGLAIVKGLVEAHRGSVEVANRGGGCRFLVRLPSPHVG